MNRLKFAYCNNCGPLVEYFLYEEIVEQISEFGEVKYGLNKVGRYKNYDYVVVGIIYGYTRSESKFGLRHEKIFIQQNK